MSVLKDSVIEKTGANTVKLTITVDADRFEEGLVSAYHKIVKRVNIPGFRKGKAPRKMVEQYYGESILYEDAFDYVFPEAYAAAVKQHELEPVDRPDIDLQEIGHGKDLVFTAAVTIKPEVKLGQYKGLELEKIEYNVTDEQVSAELERMREKAARYKDCAGPVENGHRIILDFSGSIDGVKFEGGTAENHMLEVGSGAFIPGFEEQLVGMAIGEEKDIKVTFPENYGQSDLAGKEAVFAVKVKEIKKKELPELDDDLAKDISEFDTLAELRTDIEKRLREMADMRAKRERENAVLEKAVDNAEIDVPQVMVESEIDSLMREAAYSMQRQGLTLEDYYKYTGETEADLRKHYAPQAERNVRTRLVIEAIKKIEDVKATDEEVDAEIAEMAEQAKKPADEYKKLLNDDIIAYIKEDIEARKLVSLLVDSAVWTEAKEDKPAKRAKKEQKKEDDK